jgi:hypothetical protein
LLEESPAYGEALERVWPPYIHGDVPMADAAQQIVEAL